MCRLFKKKKVQSVKPAVVAEPIQQQVNTAAKYDRVISLSADVQDIDIPELPADEYLPTFTINGNGHKVSVIRKRVKDQDEAGRAVNSAVIIDNVQFVDGMLLLHATYGSEIRNCRFVDSDLIMRFALNAKVSGCKFFGDSIHGITDGDWLGATSANSQSNNVIVEQSRHYCKKDMVYAVYVKDSAQVVLRSCIWEGEQPQRNVRADFTNGTNVQSFFIEKPWIENNPSVASFDLAVSSGLYRISDMWNQTCKKVLRVDGKSKAWYQIELSYPSLPAGGPIIEMADGAHERGFVKVICPKYSGRGLDYFYSLFNGKNSDGEVVN
jgi:hypothetical protein